MTVKEIYGTDFPIILAPMAGITDLPFRILCKEQGADVMVTEMISAHEFCDYVLSAQVTEFV